jgi:hypothetical protein
MRKTTSNENLESKNSTPKRWKKKEIAEAIRSVVLSRKRIHVIAYGGGWGVLRESSKRLNKIHNDKSSAVAHAKRLAKKDIDALVIIHKEDGSLDRYVHADN